MGARWIVLILVFNAIHVFGHEFEFGSLEPRACFVPTGKTSFCVPLKKARGSGPAYKM